MGASERSGGGQPAEAASAELVVCDHTIDITYIRLPEGFCYLAAVLDAYSRKVVGWELAQDIDARLVGAAL